MIKIFRNLLILILLFFTCAEAKSQQTDVFLLDSLRHTKVHYTSAQMVTILRHAYWHKPIKLYTWVADNEGAYTDEEINKLDSIITSFERKTTIEIAIVSLDSLQTTKDSFNIVSLHIAKKWKIGKKDKNNGVLIAVSKSYHKIRIDNGYGIKKVISDNETQSLINNYFIPYFKKGEYYNGTLEGLKELMKLLESKLH